jgi:hypothetical protein
MSTGILAYGRFAVGSIAWLGLIRNRRDRVCNTRQLLAGAVPPNLGWFAPCVLAVCVGTAFVAAKSVRRLREAARIAEAESALRLREILKADLGMKTRLLTGSHQAPSGGAVRHRVARSRPNEK